MSFVHCIDEVANTDFPEELYWQLELKEYDIKISALRQQVIKYKIALSNLARATNLSEAALMALLGYPDAAYKVWRVEYALKASQKMRLCMYIYPIFWIVDSLCSFCHSRIKFLTSDCLSPGIFAGCNRSARRALAVQCLHE